MASDVASYLILTIKDPLGVSGLDVKEQALIRFNGHGGRKTAETLHEVVCQYFKIKEEKEKKMFEAALLCFDFLDKVECTRKDGVVYTLGFEGERRKKMENPQNFKQKVILKPEQLLVHTKIGQRELRQKAHWGELANFGDEAIAFFNCNSFKKFAQFNSTCTYSRTMEKIDLMSRL